MKRTFLFWLLGLVFLGGTIGVISAQQPPGSPETTDAKQIESLGEPFQQQWVKVQLTLKKGQTVQGALREALSWETPLLAYPDLLNLAGQAKSQAEIKEGKPVEVLLQLPEHYLAYPAQLEAVLNIPAFEWRWYQNYNGKKILLAVSKVAVGNPGLDGWGAPTPIGSYYLDRVHHYPSWGHPRKQGVHVGPGPRNPLGTNKIMFNTRKRMYFHGTNKPRLLLTRDVRVFTHGCIRNLNEFMESAVRLLLKNAGWTKEDAEALIRSRRTKMIHLPDQAHVPLRMIYDLIEVRNGQVIFHPNIYGRRREDEFHKLINETHLLADLQEAGFSPDTVDRGKISDLLRNVPRRWKKTVVPVKELLAHQKQEIPTPTLPEGSQ